MAILLPNFNNCPYNPWPWANRVNEYREIRYRINLFERNWKYEPIECKNLVI